MLKSFGRLSVSLSSGSLGDFPLFGHHTGIFSLPEHKWNCCQTPSECPAIWCLMRWSSDPDRKISFKLLFFQALRAATEQNSSLRCSITSSYQNHINHQNPHIHYIHKLKSTCNHRQRLARIHAESDVAELVPVAAVPDPSSLPRGLNPSLSYSSSCMSGLFVHYILGSIPIGFPVGDLFFLICSFSCHAHLMSQSFKRDLCILHNSYNSYFHKNFFSIKSNQLSIWLISL